jgi:hypothetical protein
MGGSALNGVTSIKSLRSTHLKTGRASLSAETVHRDVGRELRLAHDDWIG